MRRTRATGACMGKLHSKIQQLYHRIISIEAEPHHIAGGVAVGMFWAFSPLWGFHMVLCVLAATILRVSRIASLVVVQLANPLTAPFMYYTTWKLGDFLLRPFLHGGVPVTQAKMQWTLSAFLNMAGSALIRMLIGGTIIGGCLGIATYFAVLWGLQFARRSRAAGALKQPAPPA